MGRVGQGRHRINIRELEIGRDSPLSAQEFPGFLGQRLRASAGGVALAWRAKMK
jgi:hypothetical protein